MIKNQHQLGISRSTIAALNTEIELLKNAPTPTTQPQIRELQIAALSSQLADIKGEVDEYLALAENPPKVLEATSLLALPAMLIGSRIALGLTQEALGQLIGVHKQTIQRYEDSDYASASFDRITEIASALGVAVSHQWKLPRNDAA